MGMGRPRQFDEKEVLQRAMELFWQRGFEGASLPQLLEAMGISRQSLYDTFGSKRQLYIRAIQHYRTTQLSRALVLLERGGSALANVKDALRFFEDLAADASCRGCLVANALVEMAPHDPEIAKLLRETLELLRQAIERALRQARAQGELPATRDPEDLSRSLTNAMLGMAVSGKLDLGRHELRGIYDGTLGMLS